MAKHEDETVAASPQLDKKSARDLIFAESSEPKRVSIVFNGVELELRQPTVQQFMDTQADEGSGKAFVVKMLIQYAYIAGTDEKPFEESDYDTLVQMPFNKSWAELTQAIQTIVDIKVEDKVKN